ncbi:MAG: hypothetical protein M0P15_09475 [Bacteroides sp.]|nr:hypothetical protein [Bacteroides sp.]
MAYTEKFKRNFINEFLERYQKDPTLTLRVFGIEKFGKVTSFIYLWLNKYDVNKIYKVKNRGPRKKAVAVATPPVVKIINNDDSKKISLTSQSKISIKIGNATIDMGNNYSKEDLILILSALKEVSYAN